MEIFCGTKENLSRLALATLFFLVPQETSSGKVTGERSRSGRIPSECEGSEKDFSPSLP